MIHFPCALCGKHSIYDECAWIWRKCGDNDPWVPVPDYANSIDAQKRDLEPLLDTGLFQVHQWPDMWTAYPRGGRAGSGKTEELARARCLGKALEARTQ